MNVAVMKFSSVALALAVCVGCAKTGDKPVDFNRDYQAFLNQPNNTELVSIKGTNISLSVTGANEIKLSTAVPAKSLYPRDPGLLSAIVPSIVQGAVAGVGIVTAGRVMNTMAAQPRTVDPVIVKPEVVSPEVIQVPAP